MAFARLRTLTWSLALALGAAGADAQPPEQSILVQLRAQGFVEFEVSRTLLGRLHILALSAGARREIVLNPGSGEILRDYTTGSSGAPLGPQLLSSPPGDDHFRVAEE